MSSLEKKCTLLNAIILVSLHDGNMYFLDNQLEFSKIYLGGLLKGKRSSIVA